MQYDTFPKLLSRNADIYGARCAMRHKDFGIWKSWTWAQVQQEVRSFALGLKTLGLDKGMNVAIIGTNRPRLYWAMCAVQMWGAVPVPLYADSVAEEMAYVLDHAEIKIAIVEDQEQVDKILSVIERLPNLKTIIYDMPKGLRDYDHTHLKSFADVQAIKGDEAALDASIAAVKPTDLSIMVYTSGTTGRPKGVMHTHQGIIISAANGAKFDNLTVDEEVISYLPLAWVGDHIFSYGQNYVVGFCVSCPESSETINECRRELALTYAFAPPRIFETLLTQTTVLMEDASALKRKVYAHYLGVAKKWGEKILNGEPVPLAARASYALGNALIYAPLRNRFGMSKVRVSYTAGEAIGPELFSFYRSIGINLKQLYGSTEASVYITAQPDGQIYADTVGVPNIDVDVKIDKDGQVIFKSPGLFVGYYKDEEKTRAEMTQDGYFMTGDAGFFDSKTGHLKIIDRIKDVSKLKNGALFAPKYLENRLKFYANIKEAVAIGQGQEYATVMLNIDLTAVGSWAERNNVNYASYQELAGNEQVYAQLKAHVEEVNRALADEPLMAASQIKRFLILHKELDADDGELTRTQKVKRNFIAERYAPFVKAFYDGSKRASISTEVTFEDGRKGIIKGDVVIMDVETYAPTQKELAA